MKNFIRGRWFPLAVAFAAVLVIACILFFCGFRITYAPELETSWDAVSAVAGWAGAIGGVAAVFSAISVANRQNKIALFEKRYKICRLLSQLIHILQDIRNTGKIESNSHIFFTVLLNHYSSELGLEFVNYKNIKDKYGPRLMNRLSFDIHQMNMLFDRISVEEEKNINRIVSKFWVACEYNDINRFQASITDDMLCKAESTMQKIKEQTSLTTLT